MPPLTFQALVVNEVLKPFPRKLVLAFFDDKLIFGIDIHSHTRFGGGGSESVEGKQEEM